MRLSAAPSTAAARHCDHCQRRRAGQPGRDACCWHPQRTDRAVRRWCAATARSREQRRHPFRRMAGGDGSLRPLARCCPDVSRPRPLHTVPGAHAKCAPRAPVADECGAALAAGHDLGTQGPGLALISWAEGGRLPFGRCGHAPALVCRFPRRSPSRAAAVSAGWAALEPPDRRRRRSHAGGNLRQMVAGARLHRAHVDRGLSGRLPRFRSPDYPCAQSPGSTRLHGSADAHIGTDPAAHKRCQRVPE